MIEPYKPLYTVKQASEVLCISRQDVYKLMKEKRLPYVILGSKKIRGTDLEQFINALVPAQEFTEE